MDSWGAGGHDVLRRLDAGVGQYDGSLPAAPFHRLCLFAP